MITRAQALKIWENLDDQAKNFLRHTYTPQWTLQRLDTSTSTIHKILNQWLEEIE